MKKWINERFDECLTHAMDTYTDLLVDEGFDPEDSLEEELWGKIRKEDYIYEEVLVSDLHKFKSFHTGTYESDVDEIRMHSGCIVVFYNEVGNLVMDGNHRKNTHVEQNSKMSIPVIQIYCKIIPRLQSPQ